MADSTNWIAFAYPADRAARSRETEPLEAQHESERELKAIGFSGISHHSTQAEAEDAARGILRKLRETHAKREWRVCVADPGPSLVATGACYFVTD